MSASRGSAAPERAESTAGERVVLARSAWPAQPPAALPAVPGFVVSSFSPLAAHLAELCLLRYFGRPPADPACGRRTAVVLATCTVSVASDFSDLLHRSHLSHLSHMADGS